MAVLDGDHVGAPRPEAYLRSKAGHYPFLEHAAKFNQDVLEFLKSEEVRGVSPDYPVVRAAQ